MMAQSYAVAASKYAHVAGASGLATHCAAPRMASTAVVAASAAEGCDGCAAQKASTTVAHAVDVKLALTARTKLPITIVSAKRWTKPGYSATKRNHTTSRAAGWSAAALIVAEMFPTNSGLTNAKVAAVAVRLAAKPASIGSRRVRLTKVAKEATHAAAALPGVAAAGATRGSPPNAGGTSSISRLSSRASRVRQRQRPPRLAIGVGVLHGRRVAAAQCVWDGVQPSRARACPPRRTHDEATAADVAGSSRRRRDRCRRPQRHRLTTAWALPLTTASQLLSRSAPPRRSTGSLAWAPHSSSK